MELWTLLPDALTEPIIMYVGYSSLFTSATLGERRLLNKAFATTLLPLYRIQCLFRHGIDHPSTYVEAVVRYLHGVYNWHRAGTLTGALDTLLWDCARKQMDTMKLTIDTRGRQRISYAFRWSLLEEVKAQPAKLLAAGFFADLRVDNRRKLARHITRMFNYLASRHPLTHYTLYSTVCKALQCADWLGESRVLCN